MNSSMKHGKEREREFGMHIGSIVVIICIIGTRETAVLTAMLGAGIVEKIVKPE